ncbi:MAG: Sua5/YciO/YrdC/YwlC family protein, tRNA threonylcarbamoyladenosine biosynthesis protein [Candidatus Peregrinibacteria bacterium GW2011_GWF2_39_17]|nr:MAG: Sua5/YciO/YrdC/YwlC family protein, tRNA threonylcarbamoyladenosine biosynthesis protein [Candidatus Peregrinibacteria bacterium GW2011_GWF2_39_17]
MILSAVKVLRQGGVVAHPTDTCYGLAVDIFNKAALERLYELKGMSQEKPVSILVRSLKEAKEYGEFSKIALDLAARYWPGSLTLVVPRTEKAPVFLNSKQDTIGIRVIVEDWTKNLLEAFGSPLSTTSANKHGQASPYSVAEILVQPDFLIDGGNLDPKNQPSTIVEVIGAQKRILRQGNIVV